MPVQEDCVEPRGEPARPIVPGQPLPRLDQRLLRQVLRQVLITAESKRLTIEPRFVLSRKLAESLTLTRQGARNQGIRIEFGIGFLHVCSARDYIPVQPQKVQLWRKVIKTGRHEACGIYGPVGIRQPIRFLSSAKDRRMPLELRVTA